MRLKISNVSKHFGAVVANDNISLSLAEGEVLALLGENGAGKTTLMNILFGHYVADQGFIEIDGNPLAPGEPQESIEAGVGMVHQHFTLADNLSVLDNITLGTEPLFQLWRNQTKAKQKLAGLTDRFGLKVDPDAMVADLSVGEKQRVEILKALYRDARILILDEPTAVLTPNEAEQLFGILREMVGQGLSVVFISHKLHEILAISDRVAVLRHGKVVGEVVTADANKALLAEMMVGHAVSRPSLNHLTPGEIVLELRDVSLAAMPGSVALKSINLKIREKEVVGIAGVAGNGQSGLASIINGLTLPDVGEFRLYDQPVKHADPRALVKAGVARIPEDRSVDGVIGEMPIWENILGEQLRARAKAGVLIDKEAALAETENLIERFDVRCEGPQAQTRLLSGGNIQKLILARSLSKQPRFIIANQPIRGLDEGAIAYVQSQILEAKEQGAGVLLISEDLDELFDISDRIAVLYHGELLGPFDVDKINVGQVGLMMSGASTVPGTDELKGQAVCV
jgi:simple sugar transport system ATP-binding protein